MRDPDELQEGVGRSDAGRERRFVEGVSDDGLAAGRELPLRPLARKRPHPVPAPEKLRDHAPTHVAAPAGDEDDAAPVPCVGGNSNGLRRMGVASACPTVFETGRKAGPVSGTGLTRALGLWTLDLRP